MHFPTTHAARDANETLPANALQTVEKHLKVPSLPFDCRGCITTRCRLSGRISERDRRRDWSHAVADIITPWRVFPVCAASHVPLPLVPRADLPASLPFLHVKCRSDMAEHP